MGELVETQAAAAGVTFHRERAGGTISFTSEEGVGTTFTIEFRFLLAPETEKGDNSKDNTMQDFQGTQQIRAMHRPDVATIPIIAMTANAFADDIQQSKEAGMSEHLSKPLDEQKMFAMIRKYCREKKRGRTNENEETSSDHSCMYDGVCTACGLWINRDRRHTAVVKTAAVGDWQ